MMKTSLLTKIVLAASLCSLPLLGGCASGSNVRHSSGTPVNPEADPGGQGIPGSRSTGANSQQSPGRR